MGSDSCKQKFQSRHKISRTRRYFHIFFAAAFLIIIAYWMDYWLRGELSIAQKFADYTGHQWSRGILIVGGILYILLLSLPFVPGVELGVLLMCVFGKEGIVFVYLATVAGLSLAFFMGRMLPLRWVESHLEKLGFVNAGEKQQDDIDGMLKNLSFNKGFCRKRFILLLTKYRYPAIGILFNMPGNYLIGGGGGISLACGISRNISWKWFLLTVIVAVSPVPLLAWCGFIQLETFLGIE